MNIGNNERILSVEFSIINTIIALVMDVAHSKFFRSTDGGQAWISLTIFDGNGWEPGGYLDRRVNQSHTNPRNLV
jgi:hypothetical protein